MDNSYRGVSWKVTDDGELIIGNGTEQTFEYRDSIRGWDYPWYQETDKIKTVRFDGKVKANGSIARMFKGISVDTIDFSGFDTSNVTDMTGMFLNAEIDSLDMTGLNTTNVTDMSALFYRSKIGTLVMDEIFFLSLSLDSALRKRYNDNDGKEALRLWVFI